jgi:hypothetical protein
MLDSVEPVETVVQVNKEDFYLQAIEKLAK